MNKIMLLLLFTAISVQLAFTEDNCHVIFGMRKNSKPNGWFDSDGKPRGLHIDLLDKMMKGAGCTYEVVEVFSWGDAVNSLESGDITMLYLNPTKKTDTFAIYIPQALVTPRYIFTRAGEPTITTKEELRGKSVVVTGGGYSDELLTDIEGEYNITILRYPSSEDAVRAFSLGTGDALVSAFSIVMNLIDEYSSNNIISGGVPLISPPGAFALHRSNMDIYTKLTNALERMKSSGEYFDILKKWSVPPRQGVWYRYLLIAALAMAAILLIVFILIKSLQMQVAKRTALLNEEMDIHKNTKEQLLNLSNLFQMVLSAIPERICLINSNYGVEWSNSPVDVPVGFDLCLISETLKNAVDNRSSFEIEQVTAGDQIWRIVGIAMNAKDPLLVIVSNITENVKLRDEALMAGRLAVLGEMSANIAHEINNPTGLMVHNTDFLRGFCAEILDAVSEHIHENEVICGFPLQELKKETETAINSLNECLFRIKTTVDELKSFTSRSPNKREIVDVRSCIQSAVKFSNYFIRKHTTNFSLDFIEPLIPFSGNTLEIEQMVVNLLHNSCQALTCKEERIACMVQASSDHRFMVISVRDEGCGMSEEVVRKAHNAFFTTRKESGGTGLGLSIVDRLMGEHGGYYTIESMAGKGTTVALYFPVLP